ncbi:hypothetical protein B0H10DRAFT_1961064 [Mycena sp. CBHHK59/15]|nr:hypothetical protein B0H10DRAFT_1961064 [Mycena sp. CBHHK59/15]
MSSPDRSPLPSGEHTTSRRRADPGANVHISNRKRRRVRARGKRRIRVPKRKSPIMHRVTSVVFLNSPEVRTPEFPKSANDLTGPEYDAKLAAFPFAMAGRSKVPKLASLRFVRRGGLGFHGFGRPVALF